MEITITTPYSAVTFDMAPEKVAAILREAVEAACPTTPPVVVTAPAERDADIGKTIAQEPAQKPVPEPPKQRLVAAPDFAQRVIDSAKGKKTITFKEGSRNAHLFGETAQVSAEDPLQDGYRGFLMIKCEHCGKVRGLCAKFPTKSYHCKECGKDTELKDLATVRFKCKCGRSFKYLTNRQEDEFEWECLDCGSSIPIIWNKRREQYQGLYDYS